MTNRVTFSDREQFWRQAGSVNPAEIPVDAGGCPICNEAFADHDGPDMRAVRTQCGHFFCLECLSTWLNGTPENQGSNTCPTCRLVLFEVETDDDDDSADEGSDDVQFFDHWTTHPSLDNTLLSEDHLWLADYMLEEAKQHVDLVEASGFWHGDDRRATIRGNMPLPPHNNAPHNTISQTRQDLRRVAIRFITQEVAWTLSRINGFETTARLLYYRLVHLCRCNSVIRMYCLAETNGLPPRAELLQDLLGVVYQTRRWMQQVVESQMDP